MRKSIHREENDVLIQLLRDVRQNAGLRQQDLAELLHQPQSFVSKYESGERRLDILELRQICSAIGVSLQWFVEKLEELLTTTQSEEDRSNATRS